MTVDGYIMVYVGRGHNLASKGMAYALEHRVVAQQKLGRDLLPGEIVHHLDENKANNDPNNLVVLPSRAHHCAEHGKSVGRKPPGEDNPIVKCDCGCGAKFLKYDLHGKPRYRKLGHYAEWMTADVVAQLRADRQAGITWAVLEKKYQRPARSLRRVVSGQRCCADNQPTDDKPKETP